METANRTAAQAYQEAQTRVAEKLALLSSQVEAMSIQFRNGGEKNWGHVGSLQHVCSELTALTDSMPTPSPLKTYPMTGRDGKTIRVTIPESEGGR